MEWLWTWKGKYFGYREGDKLWTHDGRNVGKFYGDEVYDPSGKYLGEIRNENRLITHKSKKRRTKSSFSPSSPKGIGYTKRTNFVGNVMYVGHEDFPLL